MAHYIIVPNIAHYIIIPNMAHYIIIQNMAHYIIIQTYDTLQNNAYDCQRDIRLVNTPRFVARH
jgi:hypothetical protein